MSELSNSSRRVPKATYVSIKLPQEDRPERERGAAVLKFGFVRQLGLRPGETDAVRQALGRSSADRDDAASARKGGAMWDTLRAFEGAPIPSALPFPTSLAEVSTDDLIAFGHAVTRHREQALKQPADTPTPAPLAEMARRSPYSLAGTAADTLSLANLARVATRAFMDNVAATPIGMLNLERLEMVPAGIERGGLIATIPLAPLEKTAVVHKEWSVTNKEFTSIVTDSLEEYSETGVTENTELAQSTSSQSQHGIQLNAGSIR